MGPMISIVIMRCFITLSLFMFSAGMNVISDSEATSFLGDDGESFGFEKNVPYGEYLDEPLSLKRKRGWEALDLRGKRRVPLDQFSSGKRGWEPLSFRPKSYPTPYSKRGWEFVNMRYRIVPQGMSRNVHKRIQHLDNSDFNNQIRKDGDQILPSCWCCKELGRVKCCLNCNRIGEQEMEESAL